MAGENGARLFVREAARQLHSGDFGRRTIFREDAAGAQRTPRACRAGGCRESPGWAPGVAATAAGGPALGALSTGSISGARGRSQRNGWFRPLRKQGPSVA